MLKLEGNTLRKNSIFVWTQEAPKIFTNYEEKIWDFRSDLETEKDIGRKTDET